MKQAIFTLTIENCTGWWEWNNPSSPLNLLSLRTLKELEGFIDKLEKTNLKALILTSGKPSHFSAGADIKELKNIKTPEEITNLLKRFHSLFNRLEKLDMTKIAAIHGTCLGGGLELALTFNYRIASNSKETSLGLPEVKLGLIPGLGGCVRLPKLLGLKNSLKMILKGQTLSPEKALAVGLIDEVLPLTILRKRAAELASQVEKGIPFKKADTKSKPLKSLFQMLEDYPPLSSLLFYIAKRKTLKETKNLYPAPLTALNVIKKTYNSRNQQQALQTERNCFSHLACQKESKNLIRVFSLIIKVKKENRLLTESNKNIGVLGAGTMGSGIAYVLSDKGFPTRLMDVSETALSQAMIKIKNLFGKQLKRQKASCYEIERKRDLLTPALNYQGCSGLDMVIETVPEDLKIKKQAIQNISPFLNEKMIFVSNTSSLSLNEMASVYPWPHRFLGMHFFNPVYKIPFGGNH